MIAQKASECSSVFCPNCGEVDYRKAGKNQWNGQQMLKCRKCGRFWTLSEGTDLALVERSIVSRRASGAQYIPSHIFCPKCNGRRLGLAGWLERKSHRTRRVRCKDCNQYFPCPELNHVETLDRHFVKMRFDKPVAVLIVVPPVLPQVE